MPKHYTVKFILRQYFSERYRDFFYINSKLVNFFIHNVRWSTSSMSCWISFALSMLHFSKRRNFPLVQSSHLLLSTKISQFFTRRFMDDVHLKNGKACLIFFFITSEVKITCTTILNYIYIFFKNM